MPAKKPISQLFQSSGIKFEKLMWISHCEIKSLIISSSIIMKTNLFFKTWQGNSYGADKDTSWAKPVTTKRPTTTRRPTTTKRPATKKPFKPAAPAEDQSSLAAQWYGSKPTQEPKPFFAETPGENFSRLPIYMLPSPLCSYFPSATIDPFKEATRPAAEEAEKGANPCIGLTGKRLKKCKAVRNWFRQNNNISYF